MGGSVNAGVVACEDKGCCSQQSGFRASNRHSFIFNKTVYFVVGEELAVRKLYRIQSSLKIHPSLFVLLVKLGNGIRSGKDYHEYK